MSDAKTLPSEITCEYYFTAADTDAERRMPMWLIVSRVIEVATNHANILGVGYSDLIVHGLGWVLARLSIEMHHYPDINQPYKVTTWIEGYNRLSSERCFTFALDDGTVIAEVRSMWVAIDIERRTAGDLTCIDRSRFAISERRSPVQMLRQRVAMSDEAQQTEYTFKFCDIDFNRHVNTVQYVRHILNQWPLEQYERCEIDRFDITFHNECLFGETVKILHQDIDETLSLAEIYDPQGRHAVRSAIKWRAAK